MQKRLKHYVLAAMLLLAPVAASAQVTIGNGEKPADFSVLELVSNDTRGLRLPQVTNRQRQNIEDSFGDKRTNEAMGLQIFNTSTKCVETWNGTVWISKCAMCGDEPCQYLEIECANGNIPIPEFMPYNLGANPNYDTPKEQMNYLATHSFSDTDGNVYGGRYQWGRGGYNNGSAGVQYGSGHPYAISTDGKYTLYKGTTNAVKFNDIATTATYNPVTGQIIGQDNNHLYVNPAINGASDWRLGNNGGRKDDLWGNGLPFGANNLQNPVKTINDPCPDKWRLPTQDEWERLGKYDCDPTVTSSSTAVSTSSGVGNSTTGFTWVPVVCASGSCSRNNSWVMNSTQAGYAIYRTEVWENGSSWNTGNLLAAAAPEPFMFLPAAGMRSYMSNKTDQVGLTGYYWGSTANGNSIAYSSHILNFQRDIANVHNSQHRTYGFSIRCVAE